MAGDRKMSIITENKDYTAGQRRSPLPVSMCRGTNLLRAGIALLGMCLGAGVQGADTPTEMDGSRPEAGYSAGYAFGGQLARLQRQKPGVELEAVFRGILDALSGADPRLSAAEMRAALQELERSGAAGTPERGIRPPQGRAHESAVTRMISPRSTPDAKAWSRLPSGVQYEVLKAGSGRQPAAGDAVLVSYQASLTNGAVFDTTYEDGEPVRLELEEIVVPGLKEALLLMSEGANGGW